MNRFNFLPKNKSHKKELEEELVGEIISLKREIMTAIFLLPIDRPDFGSKQIRSVGELVVGQRYIQHNALGSIEFAYEGLDEKGWLLQRSLRFGHTTAMPQTDAGLKTYQFGGWNDTNWIEDSTKGGAA